jgi:tRNA nucleotidyltransferase (CCA-adding enzyme)
MRGQTSAEGQPLYARKKVLSKLMEERLPERIRDLLMECGRVGDALGVPVYAVGGFVRDLLMGVENFDLDIVVEGDGIRFAEAFEGKYPCRIRTHKKFGTAIILFPDRLKIDVATARLQRWSGVRSGWTFIAEILPSIRWRYSSIPGPLES